MDFSKYLTSHWRGQQSLWVSFFVNGLVLFVILSILLVSLSKWINVYAGLTLVAVWEVWAAVGIIRCGVRILNDRTRTILAKAFSVLALIFVVVTVILSVRDLSHLFWM